MDKDYLTLKRASTSRPSGEWDDDDFDVLADGVVVGRIFNSNAGPVGSPWMWTSKANDERARGERHLDPAARIDAAAEEASDALAIEAYRLSPSAAA